MGSRTSPLKKCTRPPDCTQVSEDDLYFDFSFNVRRLFNLSARRKTWVIFHLHRRKKTENQKIKTLFIGLGDWSVRIGKNSALGLQHESTAFGLQLVDDIYIFLWKVVNFSSSFLHLLLPKLTLLNKRISFSKPGNDVKLQLISLFLQSAQTLLQLINTK